MGLLDRLFGGDRGRGQQGRRPRDEHPLSGVQDTSVSGGVQDTPAPDGNGHGRATGDDAAIERYRYLLRTAPPDRIEQAHAEAFAALTPEQRRLVLTELGSRVPASERAPSDDPAALARMATRAEMREPGMLERTFSPRAGGMGMGGGYGMGGGMGMGGLLAGSMFASLAGAFVGTAIADEIFDHDGYGDGNDAGADGSTSDNDGSTNGNEGNADGGNDQAAGQSDAQTVADSGGDASGAYGGDGYGGDGYGGDGYGGDGYGGDGYGGDGDAFGGGFDGGDVGGGFDA
jgi:hypothetical protein